jgi:hypothetical protein
MSLTSVAFAQSSVDGYTPDDGAVQNQIQGNDDNSGTSPSAESPTSSSGTAPEASASASDSGSLPFTGLDLALLAGAGAVLLGLGLGMRHLTRSPESV